MTSGHSGAPEPWRLAAFSLNRRPEEYTSLLVESFKSNEPGHRYPIEVRPLSGQPFPNTLLVECPMRMRTDYPVGTTFRIWATLKNTPFKRLHLYSSYKWPFEVVPKRDEPAIIRRLYQRLFHAPRTSFPAPGVRLLVPDVHGAYVIFAPDGGVAHIGRTIRGMKGLRRRLNNHLHGKSSFARNHLNGQGALLRDGYTFAYLEVPDARERALLEAYAVGRSCPTHLGLGENAA